MGSVPLPPHERPWRHPSELGPPEHEPTTGGGRLLIVTTATFGLVLVALLAVAVTPTASTSTDEAPPSVVAVRAVPATFVRLDEPVEAVAAGGAPMVAPVGGDGLALTTASAVHGSGGRLTVRLPSGQAVDVDVVSVDEARGMAVVSLPEQAPTETFALAAVSAAPVPADTVLVHAVEPVVIAVDDLDTLDVGEGTPVSDGDGNLLALCTRDEFSQEMKLTDVPLSPDELVGATAGSD